PPPSTAAPAPPPATAQPSAPPPPGPIAKAPSPATPPPAPAPRIDNVPSPGRVEKIRRYVEEYDGGECFFVAPVAIGEPAAALEGFGATTQPFERLDRSFIRDIGFEAQIGVRQITQPQCPAVTFLGRLRAERARAPRLQINTTTVRSGETLNGTIENFGARHVELLLVSDTGQVQNISYLLKEGTDAKTFSIG